MSRVRILLSALALIVLGACSTQLDGGNPYDPDTPPDKQAKASLSGTVTLEGFGDVTQVEVNVGGLTAHPDAAGAYQLSGITPGIQEILFRLSGYQDRVEPRLLDPGEQLVLDVRLKVERGGVVGTVQLEESGDHSGVTITLVPESGAVTQNGEDFALTSLSTPSGYFVFDDVPAGTYDLSATKPHYVGQVVADVAVEANQMVMLETIVLPPVAGVVEILPHADCVNPGFPDWGAEASYTCRREVTVRTIGVNALDMKISEDPTFQDPAQGDTDWVQYQMERAFSLTDGDGPKKVFVLLRGNNDMVSEILEGRVVLDTTAPEGTIDVLLRAEQCDATACYTNSESLLVQVTADEPDLMMILSLDDQFTEPAQLYSPYANMLLANLATPQEIHLRLVDRAGNTFDTMAADYVVLDLHAPTLPVIETTPEDYSRDPVNIVLTMLDASQDNIDTTLRYEYQIDPPPSAWGNEPWLEATFDANDQLQNMVALDSCTAPCDYRLHIYKLRAVDRAGNIGDPATAQLVLDQTAPDHPQASIKKITSDYDPSIFVCDPLVEEWRCKIINSDVATVWISLESSTSDPNFIQFLVSTDAGVTWHETGVGIGGIQIPVMLEQNLANEVWICGRDLAGNESCRDNAGNPVALPDQSKVTFIEDSTPPTAPSLFPEEGEVNADQVDLLIHTASTDTVGVQGYEFSVNGSAFQTLPADSTRFTVDLKRDFENVIQIHALDHADNHSGTTTARITENSTPFTLSTVSAVDSTSAPFEMSVEHVVASAQENTWVVASLDSYDSLGEYVTGTAFMDLKTGENLWLGDARANRIILKGGWLVMDVPLEMVCVDMLDPTVNPATDPLCRCHFGDCTGMPGYEDVIWNASTLVIAELSGELPSFQWLRLEPGVFLPGHPLVANPNDTSPRFAFDGKRIAWVVQGRADGPCEVLVADMPDGCLLADVCPWEVEYHNQTRPLVGGEQLEHCSQAGIGGDLVTWAQVICNQGTGDVFAEVFMANTVNGTSGYLSGEGLRYTRDGDSDITFDCRPDPWDRTPICKNVFWVDFTGISPTLNTLDLSLVPANLTGHDLFAEGLTDRLRQGLMELRYLSAEDGRIVWIDSLTSAPGIFFMDLSECDGLPGSRDCIGKFHILTESYYRDSDCSLWGDQVTYWRTLAGGQVVNLLDLGSYPWLIAEAGQAGWPVAADQKLLLIWGDPSGGGSKPYKLRVYDPADQSFDLLWSFDSTVLPITLHTQPALTAAGFVQIAPDGKIGVMYCDDTMNCDAADAVDLFQPDLSAFGGSGDLLANSFRGTPQRLAWVQESTTGQYFMLDCDMDPDSTGAPCASGSFRVLLRFDAPTRICNFNVDENAGQMEAVLFAINENTNVGVVYRLDLAALEQASPPAQGYTDVVNLVGDPGFIQELGVYNGIGGGCSPFDERAVIDVESGNSAVLLKSNECQRCSGDNPATSGLNEGCGSSPCCGGSPCVCAAGDSCLDYNDFTRIAVYSPGKNPRDVYAKFVHGGPTRVAIEGRWVAFQEQINGQDDLMLVDLQNGTERRLTYHITGQNFPLFGRFPDGLHLFWIDGRLGATQIFHTVLE